MQKRILGRTGTGRDHFCAPRMAAVARSAPLLLAFGARAASRAPRALARAASPAGSAVSRALPLPFAARTQLLAPRARSVMAQAAQSEAMPSKDESPLATKEVEAERALRRNAAASAAFKMSAVDAKARRERMIARASPRQRVHCIARMLRGDASMLRC